jgi:formylglycine-generating enzyme required for sulfatase activity
VGHVTWLLAAAYCNHLSELEGLPESEWCYDPDDPLVVDASRLSRKGYRLPTEAEWEYACRAGASTARFYGAADDLLHHYAWYAQTPEVSRPVGLLKPNDFGLFDMYGNAWEWCSSFLPGDLQEGDAAVAVDFTPAGKRLFDMAAILRSDTVRHEAANMRSAMRTSMGTTPQDHTSATGFRIARTETSFP